MTAISSGAAAMPEAGLPEPASTGTALPEAALPAVAAPLAFLYEHPQWFAPIFAELERRRVRFQRIYIPNHFYEVGQSQPDFKVLFNRMSPSANSREHARDSDGEVAAEIERITDVKQNAKGFANYQQWLAGTQLEYSVSNRGLRSGLVGTPSQVGDQIGRFEEAGVDLLLLQFSPQLEEMERFSDSVMRRNGA